MKAFLICVAALFRLLVHMVCGNSNNKLPTIFTEDPEMTRLEVAMNTCLNSAGTFGSSTVEERETSCREESSSIHCL